MSADGLTSNERATYQSMVARGVDPAVAREEALDGVDVEEVRRIGTAVLGEVSECNGLCHTEVDYPDFDNDCPVHGGEREICPEGCGIQLVDEVYDEQIGYEEQARPVVVTRLACTHEIVTEGRWARD